MTSRERARKILNHEQADRPAIDLGSTRMTGTSAWSYRGLKKALGLPSDHVRAYELYQMLAELEPEVLDALGCDFAMLPIENLPIGTTYGTWKDFTFWDGQTFQVPADFQPRVTPEGALEAPRNKGDEMNMRLPHGGRFFDTIPDKQADIFDVPHIPESEWKFPQMPSKEFLRKEEEKAQALYQASERSIVASPPFGAPQGYGGTYYWAMKMLTELDYCLAYMQAFADAVSPAFRAYLQAVGDYVDVIVISGADYGGQNQEMFNPELFGQVYTPAWRKVTDVIHEFDGVKVWIHSCGAVAGFVPYFIEAGVDILNPVQWTAAGMDLRELKSRYGDKLTFWGGAISTQRTFPFGTPEDVAHETHSVLDIMGPGGGYVVNPIHNILPEVPPENIVAMYKTAQEYRY